jgi:hypothetical protein
VKKSYEGWEEKSSQIGPFFNASKTAAQTGPIL